MKKKNDTLQFDTNKLFLKNHKAYKDGHRYIINTGGSSSGKTYSLLQLIIWICLTEKVSVSIVRNSLPALRQSAMDGPGGFFDIMRHYNLYDEKSHQKTENKYYFPNGSCVQFFGVVDGQRTKGARRDILFCNEGDDLNLEEFVQLRVRTNKTIFIDRNPTRETWIDDLIKDERAIHFHSTWKDNRFLSDNIIQDLESLIDVDINKYRVLAQGLPPTDNIRIYSHFKQYDVLPQYSDICYGLDFGFSRQAMVKCYNTDSGWYIEEILYDEGMTQEDLILFLKATVFDQGTIYCDSARPDQIESIKRAGFQAVGSDKSVGAGIDSIRSSKISVSIESINLWKEFKGYCWKTNKETGKPIQGEVLKMNDHLMDSLRYAIHTYKNHNNEFDPDQFRIY